jgi:ribose transport system permease protein
MSRRWLTQPDHLMPTAALLIVLAAFASTPLLTGRALAPFDVYNALQGFAQLGLLALAIGITMIAGEFDLSVVGTYALGGMLAVQTGATSPALGVLVAVAAGAAVGALQGGLIARLRIPSIPVTLGTYIGLLGLTYTMSGGLSRTYPNSDATLWVDQTVAGFFSPRSLLALAAFLIAALVLGGTKLGRELRAIGGDRRASRVAGVNVDRRIVGIFTASGALAALGGCLLCYSYASANPDPGLQPLILAAVAALLGGVSLAGGRGAPLGLLGGALSVALLTQIVAVTALPDYSTQLLYAALLGVIVAVESPGLHQTVARLRARRVRSAGPGRDGTDGGEPDAQSDGPQRRPSMTTETTTVAAGFGFLEAPRWRDGRLWFSDFYTYRVRSMREDGTDLREEAVVPQQPSGLGWLPDGRLLVVSMRDRRILRREPDATLVVHADLSTHATGHANDMVVDGHGRAYVGNFGFDLMGGAALEPTSLHRVDPDGHVTEVADGLWFPNGSVISPDNVLLVVETFGNRVTAFDITDDGDLVNRRVWAEFGPLPTERRVTPALNQLQVAGDGACLDRQGGLWIADAIGDRLLRVVEGGTITDEIKPGTPVYACALGGASGTTLYACAAPDFHEEARKAAPEARMLAMQVAVPGI